MKRSDFIKQSAEIVKPILNNSLAIENGITSHGSELLVSLILSEFEKLGMEPPWSDKVFQKNAKKYVEPTGNEWDEE